MGTAKPIDLAHEAAFALGSLVVAPPTRQIRHDDGREEVLEPRVMQVLVALVQAEGAIVTRSELTERCWEGRIVGEDAINRVISRLRKLADGIGRDALRLETVTKVGYRLVRPTTLDGTAPADSAVPVLSLANPRRRRVLGAAALLGTVAIGGMALVGRRHRPAPVPPEAAALMAAATDALNQVTPEGNASALGLLRQVTVIAPDYADGWGMLALAYRILSHHRSADYQAAMAARATAAAQRALALDSRNGYAMAAVGTLGGRAGNWQLQSATLRRGLDDHPDSSVLLDLLAIILESVGRMRESAALLDRAVRVTPASPSLLYLDVRTQWAANRLEDADRTMDTGFALFPLHYAVWFTRCYLYLYTGRVREAQAMLDNRDGRPAGIEDLSFDVVDAVVRAMLGRDAAAVDTAIAMNVEAARKGAGYAENAMQFAAFLGRVDTAFTVADAYFFGEGFVVPDLRFGKAQQNYSRLTDRNTHQLFLPSTVAMRRDPRFAKLVDRLGLTRFWAASGLQPDYLRA